MKLASIRLGGEERLVAVTDDGYVDLNRARAAQLAADGAANASERAAAEVPPSIVRLLELGDSGLAAAREALTFAQEIGVHSDASHAALIPCPSDVGELLPAVPNPPKIVCVARNYAEHAKEAGLEISPIPIVFARFTQTLVAHGKPVIRPTVSEQYDWEGEVAIVIGKRGHRISKADAMQHVAGYTLFNDCTVRDYQFRVTQYTSGKNFDASGPLGPYVVTADEVADPHNLDLTTTLNGEVVQSANTSDMIYDIPTIIEHISEWVTLEPGDVIPTGTPAGVGFKRQPPWFLKPGDVMQVSATGLGVLENSVVAEEEL